MGRGVTFLDPLLRRPTLVVEANDSPVPSSQAGDDEPHPREEFPEVMLDFGDHASRPVPRRRLILETPIADQRRVARSAARPGEQILDAPLQDVVGREADRVPHPSPFQCLIEGGQGKRRVGADDNRLPSRAVPINDGKQDLVPPVRTVDIARTELGREAVTLGVEDEEWVIADGFKVAVVRRLLLRPWTGLSELSISSVALWFAERAATCWIKAALRRVSPW